jgi:hypothetical protein
MSQWEFVHVSWVGPPLRRRGRQERANTGVDRVFDAAHRYECKVVAAFTPDTKAEPQIDRHSSVHAGSLRRREWPLASGPAALDSVYFRSRSLLLLSRLHIVLFPSLRREALTTDAEDRPTSTGDREVQLTNDIPTNGRREQECGPRLTRNPPSM